MFEMVINVLDFNGVPSERVRSTSEQMDMSLRSTGPSSFDFALADGATMRLRFEPIAQHGPTGVQLVTDRLHQVAEKAIELADDQCGCLGGALHELAALCEQPYPTLPAPDDDDQEGGQ